MDAVLVAAHGEFLIYKKDLVTQILLKLKRWQIHFFKIKYLMSGNGHEIRSLQKICEAVGMIFTFGYAVSITE